MTIARKNMPPTHVRNSILDQIAARLPEDKIRAIEVLSRVNAIYVEGHRDTVIRNKFEDYLAFSFANQRHGRRGKGRAFFITGESGAGKTDAVEHLLKTHPTMQPIDTEFGPVLPFVSVSLRGAATLSILGNAILEAAGYGSKRKIAQGDVWNMMPAELANLGVALVHIDETQHLLAHAKERDDLVKSLKGLMNDHEWPLRIVLSGMPEVNQMLLEDEQAERRQFSVELPSISLPEEISVVTKIITELSAAAEMDVSEVLTSDLPERIAHAANYQYGRIADVVIAAIYVAALKSSKSLGRTHFARAYLMHANVQGRDELNPFISDYWQKLDPGFFIANKQLYQS